MVTGDDRSDPSLHRLPFPASLDLAPLTWKPVFRRLAGVPARAEHRRAVTAAPSPSLCHTARLGHSLASSPLSRSSTRATFLPLPCALPCLPPLPLLHFPEHRRQAQREPPPLPRAPLPEQFPCYICPPSNSSGTRHLRPHTK